MVTIIGHTALQQLPDAEIMYIPDFLPATMANPYFEDLFHHIPWRQDPITVFGKTHPQPRLTSLHAHTLDCLLNTSPSPRDGLLSRMPSSA